MLFEEASLPGIFSESLLAILPFAFSFALSHAISIEIKTNSEAVYSIDQIFAGGMPPHCPLKCDFSESPESQDFG